MYNARENTHPAATYPLQHSLSLSRRRRRDRDERAEGRRRRIGVERLAHLEEAEADTLCGGAAGIEARVWHLFPRPQTPRLAPHPFSGPYPSLSIS